MVRRLLIKIHKTAKPGRSPKREGLKYRGPRNDEVWLFDSNECFFKCVYVCVCAIMHAHACVEFSCTELKEGLESDAGCALVLSGALTCSWESRGNSEQSCSSARRDIANSPSKREGGYHNYWRRFRNLPYLWFLSLVQAALTRSLATMRTDFALLLTAALLLDTFWVRVFRWHRFFPCLGVVGIRGATSQCAAVESKLV